MYRAWARRRHAQLEELESGRARNQPLLLITGFGAYRLLARESGLHVLELSDSDRGLSRLTARVRVAVPPLGDLPADKVRAAVWQALDREAPASNIVRRYRGDPAPLVRNNSGDWRTGRFEDVMRGDFDLLAASQS
jgi:hypothetical protein